MKTARGDRLVSPAGSSVAVLALATNKELVGRAARLRATKRRRGRGLKTYGLTGISRMKMGYGGLEEVGPVQFSRNKPEFAVNGSCTEN